ncbi:MAG TPA: helix-turn-helix domain-containing protein [Candidatus Nanoarchaeia archaeon]|nr:helix-turn-helix domain-containing protein [Candidatus Nanoarchaeia archaeon]
MDKKTDSKGLEHVMKGKIEPLLEEAMQKFLGVTIREVERDITEKIGSERVIGLGVRTDLPFKEAKRAFKREFLERTLKTHYGNVSEVADIVGLDRRSIHRDLKNLGIDMKKVREKLYKAGYFEREAVDGAIRKVLEQYKQIIQPAKLEQMYEHVPELSEHIVHFLPLQTTWKEAEHEFERKYLHAVMSQYGTVSSAARAIGLRYETLLRKMKRLSI